MSNPTAATRKHVIYTSSVNSMMGLKVVEQTRAMRVLMRYWPECVLNMVFNSPSVYGQGGNRQVMTGRGCFAQEDSLIFKVELNCNLQMVFSFQKCCLRPILWNFAMKKKEAECSLVFFV